MRIVMYVLTTLFGALGALALLRFVERIAFGGAGSGSPLAQLVMGAVFLLLAYKCYAKARAGQSAEIEPQA